MKKIICFLLVLLTASSFAADKNFPSIPKAMIQATHRLKSDSKGSTSWGACVAVDLTSMSLPGKRYLLTAAHCVGPNVSVEIITADGKEWVGAKPVAVDLDKDIALMVCEKDLPVFVVMSADTDIGDAVIAIGTPRATVLTATIGFLADKGFKSSGPRTSWFQASNAVTHGNSGGPVFDANKGHLIGIITAVVADIDRAGNTVSEAPNIALLVGEPEIESFINDNIDKIRKNKVVKVDQPEAMPIPIPEKKEKRDELRYE